MTVWLQLHAQVVAFDYVTTGKNKGSPTQNWLPWEIEWVSVPSGQRGFSINGRARVLQWRHNEHDGVSNHQPHDCLLNRLFRGRSKKTSKLGVTCLSAGNSPETGDSPTQRSSNAENVSIWWRHHGFREDQLIWYAGAEGKTILPPGTCYLKFWLFNLLTLCSMQLTGLTLWGFDNLISLGNTRHLLKRLNPGS